MDSNVVGWFEIPVTDIDRAIKFYETILGISLSRNKMGPLDMAWFPWVEGGIGAAGSLVCNEDFYRPSTDGTLVYLNSPAGDLSVELARVEDAGGKILVPRTLIKEDIGYMAVFLDTEGNRVAFHSRQ